MKWPHKRGDCCMMRRPGREQLNRLTVKTLDQVFVMRAKEGLGCCRFSGSYSASQWSVVQLDWLAATCPPGSYHHRTCTGCR